MVTAVALEAMVALAHLLALAVAVPVDMQVLAVLEPPEGALLVLETGMLVLRRQLAVAVRVVVVQGRQRARTMDTAVVVLVALAFLD